MARSRPAARAALLAAALLLATGCGPEVLTDTSRVPSPPSSVDDPAETPAEDPAGNPAGVPEAPGTISVLDTVSTVVPQPWGMTELPDGTVVVSSRDEHHLYRVAVRTGKVVDLGEVPGVDGEGDGGLLGVAASPNFVTDKRLYVYYSTRVDQRVAQVTLRPGELGRPATLSPPTVVLSGIPRGTSNVGGALVFGPGGMLFVGTGDAGLPALAGDLDSLGGKVLRMTPLGLPAPDNPFPGSVVYSYGHRDVQGLTFDGTGRLLASEVGDVAGELNWIRPGRDYGWPSFVAPGDVVGVTAPFVDLAGAETSPSGVALAGGTVYLAALQSERLWQIPVDGVGASAPPRPFLTGEVGRLRSVLALDDHSLLIATSAADGSDWPGSPDGSDGDRLLLVAID